MEGTEAPTLGAAGISEWGENVVLDGPAAELDPGSKSGWTLDFSALASPADPMSTEEWVPFAAELELEPNSKIVLRMSVLTYPEVTASFGQAAHTVAEGATQSVMVTLSADPERTVTIPIVTMEQDGASSVDYSGVPDSVTFNAGGPTEMTFTFTATQDTVDDEGESVLLGFGPDLSGGVRAGTPDETTLTITDDDPPEVSFGQSAYTVAEGGMVSVEVKLTSAPASAVTVPVTHTPQGATSAADYSGVPSSVMFSAGETSKAFIFTATQDTVDDDGESVLLTFGTLPATVQTGTTTQSTVNITDDDAAEVSFGQSAYTVAEGGMVSVEVKLTSAPASAVTVPVTHTPQGATSSADYSGVPSSVTFSAGETSKTFSFTATQDTVDDDGESVRLSFGTLPPAVRAGTPSEATVSITDDDDPPEVAFGESAYTVAEGGIVSVEVKLATALESAVTVPIRHTPQGTTSSGDYSGVPVNVTFSAGDTSKAFTFSATQDMYNDDGESVRLSFGTLPPAVRAGTPSEATVSITDDDDPPEVTFAESAYTVAEGGIVSVEVKLATALESAVTVPIRHTPQGTTSSGDYSGVPANVTFNTGETEKSFTFSATQDMYNDDGESVRLSFGTLPPAVRAGTPSEATVSITDDDDPPEVAFGESAYTVAEGGIVSVEVKLATALESAVTVPIRHTPQGTTSSGDYSGVPVNVTFSAGDTSKAFTFSATQDMVDDDGESVRLSFGTLPPAVRAGTPGEATVSITDDDDPPEVAFGESAYTVLRAEGGIVSVEVKLATALESAVTVPIRHTPQGTTSSGDYSGVPVNVTFSAGDTSKAFTFSATQDMVDDDGESVRLSFGTLPPAVRAGTPGETTVSITDDDIPSSVVVSFGSTTYTVTEGGTVDITVILDDDPEQTVTVPIRTINEGGASDSDYSGVPATVTFSSGETEKTFTVTATEDNLEDGGEGVKLSFGTLPPETTPGTTNQATVIIINRAAQNSLTVGFQSAAYSVPEGDSVTVTVILSTAPGSDVTVLLTVREQDGASAADYSGVPVNVMFSAGETSKAFTVSATQDMVDDDGESVVIRFGFKRCLMGSRREESGYTTAGRWTSGTTTRRRGRCTALWR